MNDDELAAITDAARRGHGATPRVTLALVAALAEAHRTLADVEKRIEDSIRDLHPLQREWFDGIVAPYLDGRQDNCAWALIDNARADELRFALQALIVVHVAASRSGSESAGEQRG